MYLFYNLTKVLCILNFQPNGLPGNPMEAWLAFWAQNYGKGQKFQFNRNKRAVDPPSQEDYIKFAQGLADFKAEKKANIANLTCVLRKMDYFDSKLGVNIKHFTRDMWSKMKNVDPEMKSKMVEGYQMCYEYSESIPQDLLEKKGPFFAQFGRQMKFFKCGEVRFAYCDFYFVSGAPKFRNLVFFVS